VYPPARKRFARFGPGMSVPIVDPEAGRLGVLSVAKYRGRPSFDDQDAVMLGSFTSQAVLAGRLNEHRAQVEELRVLEERDRIARDMHDHILQELFATGLTLQSIASAHGVEPPDQQRQRLMGTVSKLDAVIRQIRTTIFGLQPPVLDQRPTGLVRHQILDVVQDITGLLGFTPSLHFRGLSRGGTDFRGVDGDCRCTHRGHSALHRDPGLIRLVNYSPSCLFSR
jgi:two-component system, NarL family, sensor histidine kinase DevS